ncbi:unnamed protein product [Moneuplotes crassus]|uniref:Uncharacterized protein n=1 Tax=Euplotes crassus TaxID=5936 RepID=A0AAD1Y7Z9_EUPCR|nr:unnamed protein product [Moneuplotes crassus]
MANLIKNQIEEHLSYVSELEKVSLKGRREMEEFLQFVKKKIQTEKSKTSHLSQLFNFETKNLQNSPFAKIIETMKQKCKNEAEQYQDFVKNLVEDVATPFKKALEDFNQTSQNLFGKIKDQVICLSYDLDKFQKMQWRYEDSSKAFIKTLYKYDDFQRQSTEHSSVFYQKKLFQEIGSQMVINEEKVIECASQEEGINEIITEYSQNLENFRNEFEQLESNRFQSIEDAMNKIVIFETSCDLNNKYDTKGMADLVEKLDREAYCNKIKVHEISPLQKLDFHPEDELKYLDLLIEDSKDNENIDQKYQEVVDFIDKILNCKNRNEIDHIMNNYFHTFISHLQNSTLACYYKCRDAFIETFYSKITSKNTALKGKFVYDALVAIFKRVLEAAFEKEDTECGYKIVPILRSFYYSSSEDIGFVYLQNELKDVDMYADDKFWERYCVLYCRDVLRDTDFDEQEKKYREFEIKKTLYNSCFKLGKIMLGFNLPKDTIKSLLFELSKSFKLQQTAIDAILCLTDEDREELKREKEEENTNSASGWFGAFSKIGAIFNPLSSTEDKRNDSSSSEGESKKEEDEDDATEENETVSSNIIEATPQEEPDCKKDFQEQSDEQKENLKEDLKEEDQKSNEDKKDDQNYEKDTYIKHNELDFPTDDLAPQPTRTNQEDSPQKDPPVQHSQENEEI